MTIQHLAARKGLTVRAPSEIERAPSEIERAPSEAKRNV